MLVLQWEFVHPLSASALIAFKLTCVHKVTTQSLQSHKCFHEYMYFLLDMCFSAWFLLVGKILVHMQLILFFRHKYAANFGVCVSFVLWVLHMVCV